MQKKIRKRIPSRQVENPRMSLIWVSLKQLQREIKKVRCASYGINGMEMEM